MYVYNKTFIDTIDAQHRKQGSLRKVKSDSDLLLKLHVTNDDPDAAEYVQAMNRAHHERILDITGLKFGDFEEDRTQEHEIKVKHVAFKQPMCELVDEDPEKPEHVEAEEQDG